MEMENEYLERAYTVYDEQLETGNMLLGGFIVAAVFANKTDADAAMSKYRENRKRYDVRPSGAGAIAAAALEIAQRCYASK